MADIDLNPRYRNGSGLGCADDWRRIIMFSACMSLWLAGSVFHLDVTDFLLNPIETRWGTFEPEKHVNEAVWMVAAVLVIAVLCTARTRRRQLKSIAYWLLWGVVMGLTHRYLLYSTIEHVHIPQYVVITYLLVLSFDPERTGDQFERIFFWATFMGILDEMSQYFIWPHERTNYLDFNDFFLNQLGVMAGLLLAYGFRDITARPTRWLSMPKTLEFKFAAGIAAAIFIFSMTGHIQNAPLKGSPAISLHGITHADGHLKIYLSRHYNLAGNWHRSVLNDVYYVLTPLAGIGLMLVSGLLFATFNLSRAKDSNK